MSDVTTIEADVPGRYADAVSARLRTAADDDVVGRLWRKDGTLWAPEGTPEVTNRLGWLDIAERSREQLAELEGLRDELVAEGYTDAIVLGMGGSSLAPEVFRQSFGPQDERACACTCWTPRTRTRSGSSSTVSTSTRP